ncbi:UNVERIFIED_CONTAM: AAA-ATPase [Sesamum calycinum]|uniref:AAA-ATPase n=1 Tax=Sesamum calycinum TaxID=2727403 RepID=A0AAW2MNQ5_9LAMI
MEKDQEVTDSYKGFQLKWQFILVEPDEDKDRFQSEKRYFELTFEKQNKDTVLNDYLPFVLAKAEEMIENERAVKLYTRDSSFDNTWSCINLDHPLTFDKLAMDPNMKRAIIEDLDRFDVYDLELTSLYSNSELRRILLHTNNKSILVIEDIDCSAQMLERERDTLSALEDSSSTRLTLSGLLNFIDGLWSTCGDGRISIFTTNHKEKLDPALLRPGRMDMHIYMGYCTPEGFDVLASNYLGINDHHRFFPEIKQLIQEVEITPAEIAEHLMRSEDINLSLKGVVDLLKQKKVEKNNEMLGDQMMSSIEENKSDEGVDQGKKRNLGRIMKELTNLKRRTSREIGKRKMM